MQVTETLNEGLKRGYTIIVTAAELDAKVNEKLIEAQPDIEMKGFRKGKVPMAMLKKQFGSRVLGEATGNCFFIHRPFWPLRIFRAGRYHRGEHGAAGNLIGPLAA